MSIPKTLAAIALCAWLAGCGGGGSADAGTSPFVAEVHDDGEGGEGAEAVAVVESTLSPLSISVGANNDVLVNELTYARKFVISVVDPAGVGRSGVDLAVALDLPQYRKGFYSRAGDKWVQTQTQVCDNEDTDRNGSLDVGEDVNSSGRIEPGKSDISISLLQAKTGADGTAEVQILYAKSFGSWVDALITVSAPGVVGTEKQATYRVAPVTVDADSLESEVPPPYVRSPYGTAPSCASRD